MKVVEKSYNVLTIDVGEITPGTPKVIGTNLDYQAIKRITGKSGLLKVRAVIGDFPMSGTMAINPWMQDDKLEATCLTNVGEELKAIVGTLEPSLDGMKATVILQDLVTT